MAKNKKVRKMKKNIEQKSFNIPYINVNDLEV